MKRVVGSGSVKLPYVEGSEKDIFQYQNGMSADEYIALIYNSMMCRLEKVSFTFEIKAPHLILQTFQNSNLGTLNVQKAANHLEGYLPSQFYKQDPLQFIPMDSKSCNELYTKLNNFYNWSFNFYNKLIDNGLCEEQAKLVLPTGMFVTFLWDINAKDLIEFIEKNYNVSPEIYGYCSTFVLYLEEHLPLITKWLKENQWKNIGL